MTGRDRRMVDHEQEFDGWCEGVHPEHDWRVVDERDGERTMECRRCGADIAEPIAEGR